MCFCSASKTHITPDLALVPGHDGGDMALNGRGQGGLVVQAANPSGQLRVPDEGVPADGLVVCDGEVDEVVGLAPRKRPLVGLYALPLHAVLRRDLSEVGLDDGRVLSRRQATLVGTGTEVELALGLHQLVYAHRSLAMLDCRRTQCRQRGQEKEERRLHCRRCQEGPV